MKKDALSGIIFERIGDGQGFARIRSKGDQALFGGLTDPGHEGSFGDVSKAPSCRFDACHHHKS